MPINNVERNGIVVECKTCGWKSGIYLYSEEGGKDCAKASAIIETRLGHINETATVKDGKTLIHQVDFVEVSQ